MFLIKKMFALKLKGAGPKPHTAGKIVLLLFYWYVKDKHINCSFESNTTIRHIEFQRYDHKTYNVHLQVCSLL